MAQVASFAESFGLGGVSPMPRVLRPYRVGVLVGTVMTWVVRVRALLGAARCAVHVRSPWVSGHPGESV